MNANLFVYILFLITSILGQPSDLDMAEQHPSADWSYGKEVWFNGKSYGHETYLSVGVWDGRPYAWLFDDCGVGGMEDSEGKFVVIGMCRINEEANGWPSVIQLVSRVLGLNAHTVLKDFILEGEQ